MKKERFYIGNGKDETVQKYLKKHDEPLAGLIYTGGFCDGEEWFVFVDSVAIGEYILMSAVSKMETLSSVLKSLPYGKIRSLDEFKDAMERADLIVETYGIKVDENELMQRIIYQINECVLHELSLHHAANLPHDYFLGSIRFVSKSLEKEEVYGLIRKYDLKGVNAFLDQEGKRVTRLWFKEVEKQNKNIKKLYSELKSRGLKLEAGYRRKEYPIEFGLDDIKILEKRN